MNQLLWKIEGTALRIWHAFSFLPIRLFRIGLHFYRGIFVWNNKSKVELPISKLGLWWVEFSFLLVDVFAASEVYETLNVWLKWNTRKLTSQEIEIGKSVFGNSVDYRRVRVDETARIACRDSNILYVSFFTINSWGQFRPDILVHELMHVWQYQRCGAVYIPRALLAQRTPMGYNYGGAEALVKSLQDEGTLLDFNFEQQADIISDGFCLRHGLVPKWTTNDVRSLPIFENFLVELLDGK